MIQNFKTQLLKKEQLTENIWQFTFRLIEPSTLEFEAGQYMILKLEINAVYTQYFPQKI